MKSSVSSEDIVRIRFRQNLEMLSANSSSAYIVADESSMDIILRKDELAKTRRDDDSMKRMLKESDYIKKRQSIEHLMQSEKVNRTLNPSTKKMRRKLTDKQTEGDEGEMLFDRSDGTSGAPVDITIQDYRDQATTFKDRRETNSSRGSNMRSIARTQT